MTVVTVQDKLVVYIVDDDAAVGKGFERLMRSAGLRPVLFQTGEAFLATVRTDRPCCLLLDMTMPERTGLDVQAALRQAGITLPVIAISARDDEETRHRARALGAQFFLSKPVDDHALLDAIEWVTDTSRKDSVRGADQKS